MLSESTDPVELAIGKNHVRLVKGNTVFTSKLIDGRFPEYRAVVPKGTDKHIKIDRDSFTRALQRASILSNEKYKGVRLEAEHGRVKIIAHNPQHEEAVEELEAELNFDNLAIGFNVTYLLDALLAIDSETVLMELKDANSSCLISAEGGGRDRHVVMPLKL
jgi:DNA polymerase-3 subunit beta